MISPVATVLKDVDLGEDTTVDEYCLLGVKVSPVAGPLVIGGGTHIRSHCVLYAGSRIGRNFTTGHMVLIRDRCTIGDSCSIGSSSVVEFSVTMGDGVRLHSRCFVPEHSILMDGCWLGPGVVLTNSRYPGAPDAKSKLEGVIIESHARVGANSTILPGVRIGSGALVGAGSVVTRDVAPGAIVLGNPARNHGQVSDLTDESGSVYGVP